MIPDSKTVRLLDQYETRFRWDATHSRWLIGLSNSSTIKRWLTWNELKTFTTNEPTIQKTLFNGPIDTKSKVRAYALFDSTIPIEGGTVTGLKQIHRFLFGGLYQGAGKIRTVAISKGGFTFALPQYLDQTLTKIEAMSEQTLDEIVDKYVEMNVAHPFMDGNGRSTRLWLNRILKKRLAVWVDWSKINVESYHSAMERSVVDTEPLKALLIDALTPKVDDLLTYRQSIDQSYAYEEQEGVSIDTP